MFKKQSIYLSIYVSIYLPKLCKDLKYYDQCDRFKHKVFLQHQAQTLCSFSIVLLLHIQCSESLLFLEIYLTVSGNSCQLQVINLFWKFFYPCCFARLQFLMMLLALTAKCRRYLNMFVILPSKL